MPLCTILALMTRADRTGVHKTIGEIAGRAQRVEDRHHPRDVFVTAADHQAVTLCQTPDPTGHTGVDE